MAFRRKLTPQQEKELLAWYRTRSSFRQKAREYGCNVATLYNYVHGKHKGRQQVVQ